MQILTPLASHIYEQMHKIHPSAPGAPEQEPKSRVSFSPTLALTAKWEAKWRHPASWVAADPMASSNPLLLLLVFESYRNVHEQIYILTLCANILKIQYHSLVFPSPMGLYLWLCVVEISALKTSLGYYVTTYLPFFFSLFVSLPRPRSNLRL